jgi:hypothetical protein
MHRIRSLSVVAAGSLALLAGCGGAPSHTPPAPGTPQNPLVGRMTPDDDAVAPAAHGGRRAHAREEAAERSRSSHAAKAAAIGGRSTGEPSTKVSRPGYQALVQRQSHRPQTRFTPCGLVSAAQAREIVGAPVQQPFEAPQGPTCIYRSQSGRSFVTVAVQSASFARIKARMEQRRTVALSGHRAYCGSYGQPMLYVPLAGGKLLTIGARCGLASEFARRALPHL